MEIHMKYFLFFLALICCTNELVAQLSFGISTDKTVYSFNDPIIITITARNFGSTPDTLGFPTSCQAGYYIDTLDIMYHDSISIICVQVFTERIILPSDSITWGGWLYNFTGSKVGSGRHAVVGWLDCLPNGWLSDTLWIEVTTPTGVLNSAGGPYTYFLKNNYPNPFNPTTSIEFTLPNSSPTVLSLFNVLGEEIATLVDEELPAGTHTIEWNAGPAPSGVYFCRLQAGSYAATKKILLLR